MKIQTLNKIIVLLVALFANVSSLKAQGPFGIPFYENCYQSVQGGVNGGNNSYRFLNTTAGRKITMVVTNPLDISDFDIYVREYGSNGFDYNASVSSEFIVPAIYESILIVPNRTSTAVNYSTTQIDFVDFDFQISPLGNDPCLTFDNFRFKLSTNLDGLCMTPITTLKIPSNVTETYGLGSEFEQRVFENSDLGYNIPVVGLCGGDISCTDGVNTIPCCLRFNMEVTLLPCIGKEENCPEITFTEEITICCSCGPIPPND